MKGTAALAAIGLLLVAAPANAQWELEGYGGLSLLHVPAGGSTKVPDPGPAIATSSPIAPSRQTPSWLFGDGAAMLNEASAQLGVPSRVTPLEAVVASLGVDTRSGTSGVRLRRMLSPRVSAEVDVGIFSRPATITNDLIAGAASSGASFESAMQAVLATGPFTGTSVRATTTAVAGSSRDVIITGGLRLRFAPRASFVPYATVGAGVVTSVGDDSSVVLQANYRFSVFGVPIDETDRVTLRSHAASKVIASFGAGLQRDVTHHIGVAFDARMFLGGNSLRVRVDASPEAVRGTPAGFVESFTNPNLQFSNDTATGRQSTLSGPPLRDFMLFAGEGFQTRVLLTVGLVLRF